MGVQANFSKASAKQAGAVFHQGEFNRYFFIPGISTPFSDYSDDDTCCVDFNTWGSNRVPLLAWFDDHAMCYQVS